MLVLKILIVFLLCASMGALLFVFVGMVKGLQPVIPAEIGEDEDD